LPGCFLHQEEKDVPGFVDTDQILQHQVSGRFVCVPEVEIADVSAQLLPPVLMPCHCGQSLAY